MQFNELVEILDKNPERSLSFTLPNGDVIPYHFHVTEVGVVEKTFVDCGGTLRKKTSCVLQVWVADDVKHRLTTSHFRPLTVFRISAKLANNIVNLDDLPVDVEYGKEVISEYRITGTLDGEFWLSGKQTECLAPDKCGVKKPCCGGAC